MKLTKESLIKKIEKISKLEKGLEYLKKNDYYKTYQADLTKLNAFKVKILTGLCDKSDDLQEVARNRAIEKLASIENDITDMHAKMNEAAKDPDSNEPLYSPEVFNEDLASLQAEKAKIQREINEPKWEIIRSFEVAVNVPPVSKFTPKTFARVFVEGRTADIEGNAEDFEKYDINSTLEFYAEYIGEDALEKMIDEIEAPTISKELDIYAETNESPFDMIKGLKTKEEIEETKELVKDAEDAYKTSMSIEDRENMIQVTKIAEREDLLYKNVELNAARLKTLLADLTPADGEAYKKRLEAITAILVNDSASDGNRCFYILGVNKDYFKDYTIMANYIKELILRSDVFNGEEYKYTEGINFDEIGFTAEMKFKDNPNADNAHVHEAYKTLHTEGKNFELDKLEVFTTLNGPTSNSSRIKAFNKIITDTLNGNSPLKKFEGKTFENNSENIAKISNYIVKLYNMELDARNTSYIGVEPGDDEEEIEAAVPKNLNELGLTSEVIKKNNENLLDGEAFSKEMLKKFTSELNLYRVEGAEFNALNDPSIDHKDKTYLKALAKTEGLRVDKDDKMLNDAIATYGRMKEYHATRPTLYWLFHPVNNAAEKLAIEKMHNELTTRFGFTDQELNERVNAVKDFATDPIYKNYVKATNENAYKTLVSLEKENKTNRDLYITNQLESIDKYGTRTIPADKVPGKVVVHSRINDLVVDDIPVVEEHKTRTMEEFLKYVGAKNDTILDLQTKLGHKEVFDEKEKALETAKEYEEFVDYNGYMKDKDANFEALNNEVAELKAIADAKDKKEIARLKEIHEKNNLIRKEEKALRTLNSEARLDKFFKLYDKYENDLENKAIAAATGDEKAKLEKEHNAMVVIRENREAMRKANIDNRNEERKLHIEKIEMYKDEKVLNEEYNKLFNSVDDTLRANAASAEENKTLSELSKKFGLDKLEEDTKEKDAHKEEVAKKEAEEELVKEVIDK